MPHIILSHIVELRSGIYIGQNNNTGDTGKPGAIQRHEKCSFKMSHGGGQMCG